MSSPGENDITFIKSIDRPARCCRLRSYTVAVTVVCVWFPSQFQYQRTNKLYEKNKEAWCIFLNYWIISSACSPLASKIFALGKILQLLLLSADHRARWPLCNQLWEHRFSVPDLVSSPITWVTHQCESLISLCHILEPKTCENPAAL